MKLQTLLEQAQLFSDNENYEKSYELLKTAYEMDKKNPETLEKIAIQAKILDMKEDAAKYWEELILADPNNLLAYSELQDIYFSENKYKYYLTRAKVKILHENLAQAVPDYKKALDNTNIDNEIVEARHLLARAYEFLNKPMNAIDEYYKIIAIEEDLSVYLKMAELYASMGDKHSAVNILSKASAAYPDDMHLKETLAGFLLETNQLDDALEHVQSDLTKAKIYLSKGENEKAFEVLSSVKDTKSSNYFALMAEYYFNKKEFEQCLENVMEFKKLEPMSPLTYQMMALVNEEQEDMFNAHYNWGRFYLQKRDYDMALNEFLQAHTLDNKNAQVIKEIININEGKGDDSSLMEFYEKLLAADPQNQSAMKKLAKIYEQMYEFKNALDFYLKVEELNNKDYQVFKDIGFCYEKLRKEAQAKSYYQKYVDKAPLSEDTESVKQKISKMSDEDAPEDEGFLEKIMKMFSR